MSQTGQTHQRVQERIQSLGAAVKHLQYKQQHEHHTWQRIKPAGKIRKAAYKVTQTHLLNCQLALQLWSGASSRSLQQVTRSAFLRWYVHVCTSHLCTCNASLRSSVCMLRTDLYCFMQTVLHVPPTLLDAVASNVAWYAACRIISQSTMPVRDLGTRQLVMGMHRRARGFG